MPLYLGMKARIWIIFVVLISNGLLFSSASAQETNKIIGFDKAQLTERMTQFDHLLNIGIAAPLTALSLTGATFLTRSPTDDNNTRYAKLMLEAKKSLIKAFVLFLACTIIIFVFDFIELLFTYFPLVIGFIDLVTSYSLLFAGFAHLALAAKNMYRTQAKIGF